MRPPTITRVTYACESDQHSSKHNSFQAYQLWWIGSLLWTGGLWACRSCVIDAGHVPVKLRRLDGVLEEKKPDAREWLFLNAS